MWDPIWLGNAIYPRWVGFLVLLVLLVAAVFLVMIAVWSAITLFQCASRAAEWMIKTLDGYMSEDITSPLIGNVTVQFTCHVEEDLKAILEKHRLEQEEMVGYPLVLAGRRQITLQNDKGENLFEVFATFTPAPGRSETGEHDA